MQATVELPEPVFRKLETLARREGATTAEFIRRLIEARVAQAQPAIDRQEAVRLPLIPVSETGPIHPVTGGELDKLFSGDDFTA